jgi:hypothetical protein
MADVPAEIGARTSETKVQKFTVISAYYFDDCYDDDDVERS